MSPLWRLLCVSLIVASSGSALAGPIGPFDDGGAYLPPGPVAKWIQTTWKADVGGHIYTGTDLIHIKKNGSIDVYVKVDLFLLPGGGGGGSSPSADEADLVTIYGKQAPGAPKTGFDPSDLVSFDPDAAIGFDGKEHHWGGAGSGVEYLSFSEEWIVASQLATALPGADLSGFDTSSPTQSYRVYKTTVPLQDYLVPEPSTWVLGVLGAVGLMGATRRHRRSSPSA